MYLYNAAGTMSLSKRDIFTRTQANVGVYRCCLDDDDDDDQGWITFIRHSNDILSLKSYEYFLSKHI